MGDFLSEKNIKELVEHNLDQAVDASRIKALIDGNDIPELSGTDYYQGKVRANFTGESLTTPDGRPLRVIIATDQISTHDSVRGAIPFRGQILTGISNDMLAYTETFIPNAQLFAPENSAVVIAENCEPFMFEMVWRTHMCKSSTETSLYYHYVDLGKREFCGHTLPEGLVPNGPLPYMMDTPSTKASGEGEHDISVSPGLLYNEGVVTPAEYGHVLYMTGYAYLHGQERFGQKGIIIPDTKFELGRTREGRIVTIDEVLTPDSSRFWLADDYQDKMARGEAPTSYSKQFGRDVGTPGQPYTDEERFLIGCRYIDTYQKLMGKRFVPDLRPVEQRLIEDIRGGLKQLRQK
ncbi:MAG: phosphoribosylaminoimidazolesuccinocarboxamide synthase [Desulfobacteraceae bacterium]|nr:phosphoribosylaminoimidazolesuccinocarboxamide synthase [Desulfobacteraceae bacterium]